MRNTELNFKFLIPTNQNVFKDEQKKTKIILKE